MFSVYGLTGPIFTGNFEQFYQVHPALPVRPAAAVIKQEQPDSAVSPEVRWRETMAGHAVSAASHGGVAPALRAYTDAAQADVEHGPLYRAGQIMRRQVIVLGADEAVDEAWRVLSRNTIHQAPVLDAAERLVGLVSERDLLRSLNIDHGQPRDVLPRKVRDMMSTPVVCAGPDTDIRQIARVMVDHHVDGVPIVGENHELAGFVSRTDILNAVMRDPPLSLWR